MRVGVGKEHGELVAGQPGQHVRLAQPRAERAGDTSKQVIARVVAERVVDVLEAVDVEHERSSPHPIAPSVLEVRVEPPIERAPVQQAGERIVVGHVLELFLVAPAVRDVDALRQEVARLAVGVAQ